MCAAGVDREQADALAYLMPLARMLARHYEWSWDQRSGELLTQAMMGAHQAACRYDGHADPNGAGLWAYGNSVIRHTIVDEERLVRGRQKDGGRYHTLRHTEPVGLWQAPLSDDDYDPRQARAIAYDEPGFAAVEAADAINHALARLDPRLRWIVTQVYLCERSQDAVGADLGVTGSRVCQLVAHARQLMAAHAA